MNELLRQAVEALQSIDSSLRLIALHLNYMSQDARRREGQTADAERPGATMNVPRT